MGFSGKSAGAGCHFPLPEDLPDSGIKTKSPVSPALLVNSLPTEPQGKPSLYRGHKLKIRSRLGLIQYRKGEMWAQRYENKRTLSEPGQLQPTHQGERPATDPSLTALRKNQPCHLLDLKSSWRLRLPELWDNKFQFFKAPSCWHSVTAALMKMLFCKERGTLRAGGILITSLNSRSGHKCKEGVGQCFRRETLY